MKQAQRVLIIDDEPQLRHYLAQALSEDGWETSEAESAEQAFEMLREEHWPVVLCDVMLGGADGFNVLRRCTAEAPQTKVVLMTGHGTAIGALDASAFGAYDYLLKPFGLDDVHSLSKKLRDHLAGAGTHASAKAGVAANQTEIDMVGRSAAFIEVMKQVGRVAPTNLAVLLAGETGTGKELVAAALHRRSGRADKPFIAVNCGAIPAELIESEFFGHVKGSFTGADRNREGLWEQAGGGTVFLDEITETSPQFQVKLLRSLQEGEIRRVGSNQTVRVDVRVVAASNCDVEREVEAGRFRKDLFYRLNAVSIVLPPLRERREDIVPLARSFARRVSAKSEPIGFSAEALRLLERYPWPGNVRELENAVVRASVMCDGRIREQDLPEGVRSYRETLALAVPNEPLLKSPNEWPPLARVEGRYVARVLAYTEGNKQAAARLLGVDRKTLDRMIKRHQIASSRLLGPLRAA